MALVMTMLTVVAMLGGISLLLWFSTVIEARHLGPAFIDMTDEASPATAPAASPGRSVVETAVQSAA